MHELSLDWIYKISVRGPAVLNPMGKGFLRAPVSLACNNMLPSNIRWELTLKKMSLCTNYCNINFR